MGGGGGGGERSCRKILEGGTIFWVHKHTEISARVVPTRIKNGRRQKQTFS